MRNVIRLFSNTKSSAASGNTSNTAAARQIAIRMAELIGEPAGKTVGYRIRFESRVSAATRIEVLTEGVLVRRLVDDPGLEGVSVVIFDEFHERSLTTEVALALTREAQQVLRPDLRMLVMSATIDTDALCRDLDAPLVESRGKMFPVEVVRGKEEAKPENAAELVAQTVRLAHRDHAGDILAFLPGEADIRRCAEHLGASLGETQVFPLYGMLSGEEQRRAIAPSAPGSRKIVLATPIAETSLTIEGVRVVVDSGLCRKPVYDPQRGLSRLETVRISRDMADQRAGRAGRVAPGVCTTTTPESPTTAVTWSSDETTIESLASISAVLPRQTLPAASAGKWFGSACQEPTSSHLNWLSATSMFFTRSITAKSTEMARSGG